MIILSIIGWIIVGGIIGALARFLVPGPDPMSVPMTIAIGIAGEVIASLIFYAIFGVGAGWIAGILVTMGLVVLARRTSIGRGTRV